MTREEIINLARGLCTDFKCESDTMVDFCNSIIRELETASEDCISRKAVLKIYNEWFNSCNIADKKESPKAQINALPPVLPQPKMGHWIRTIDEAGTPMQECDKCGWQQIFDTDFCPNCGQPKMQEVEE